MVIKTVVNSQVVGNAQTAFIAINYLRREGERGKERGM